MHHWRSLGLTSTASHHQMEDEQHKARTSYSAPARARTCRAWQARGFANPTTGLSSASPPYRNRWNLVDNNFGCWRPGMLQHVEKTTRNNKKETCKRVREDRQIQPPNRQARNPSSNPKPHRRDRTCKVLRSRSCGPGTQKSAPGSPENLEKTQNHLQNAEMGFRSHCGQQACAGSAASGRLRRRRRTSDTFEASSKGVKDPTGNCAQRRDK